jgi:hypothetical protein
MGRTQGTYNIFLSHSRKEKPWVRRIVGFLRDRGLSVFFDEDSITPGDNIVIALENAIESSEVLVLVLSRSSVYSKWVAFETTLRIYNDPLNTTRRLVPILIEPIDRTLIPSSVRQLDAVDLTDPTNREIEFLHFLRSLGLRDVDFKQLLPWPEPSGIEELHIADLSVVSQWHWSGRQLLEKLIALDYEILHELTPEQEGHASQWAPVFLDHPDTWRLLITPANEIIGYWHFVPLFEEDYCKAMQGRLRDSEITTDKIRLFELPGRYPIYFVSFGLLPRFRRTKGYKLLLDSLFDVFFQLAKDGILLDQVCANAFTPSGDSMCKSFGLKFVGPHLEKGNMYCSTVSEILESNICTGYRELITLYKAALLSTGDKKHVRTAIP